MKTKNSIIAIVAIIAYSVSGIAFTSCDKLNEVEGMNEPNAYYSYGAAASDSKIKDVAAEFDYYIHDAVGNTSIKGGADDKVISVCDKCYNHIKNDWGNVRGSVRIIKRRHPDGVEKAIKTYNF